MHCRCFRGIVEKLAVCGLLLPDCDDSVSQKYMKQMKRLKRYFLLQVDFKVVSF
jgi:hypothetical protein